MLDVALSSRVGAEFVGLACLFRAAVQGEDRHVASGEMGIPCAGCQGFASDNVSVPAPKSRRNPGATRARDSFGERPSNSPNAGPGKPARAAARLGGDHTLPSPDSLPARGRLGARPLPRAPFSVRCQPRSLSQRRTHEPAPSRAAGAAPPAASGPRCAISNRILCSRRLGRSGPGSQQNRFL